MQLTTSRNILFDIVGKCTTSPGFTLSKLTQVLPVLTIHLHVTGGERGGAGDRRT